MSKSGARFIMQIDENDINNIPGWTDVGIERLYTQMVDEAKDGDRFVEIGAWLGKSTAVMASLIRDSGKDIKFYVIDTWSGEDLYNPSYETLLKTTHNHNIYHLFIKNMADYKLLDYIIPIMMPSLEAVKLFDDKSLDFVFIDGDHSYSAVFRDIKAWYEKVKVGKVLAGHDYGPPRCTTIGTDNHISTEIMDAVNAALKNKKFYLEQTSYVCRVVE